VIRAGPQDAPEIAAFLTQHRDTSMFALSNLAQHGMGGAHPRALRCWLQREDGRITAAMIVTEEGMAMPQCPPFRGEDWAQAVAATAGLDLIGIIGPTAQTRAFAAAAGLQDAPATLDRDEPFMALSLAELEVPDGPGRIVPLADAPRQVVFDWMTAYGIEALGAERQLAAMRAEESLAAYLALGSHVVLMQDATPLAMTGFNARLPEIVQIGGVYTPPTLRNRGYARRAVALHLAQAKAEGAFRAVLFSASEAAARAYDSIGFRQTGHWTLCLFHGPQAVRRA
jgi:GNAT superfamily N-acetyltransferase